MIQLFKALCKYPKSGKEEMHHVVAWSMADACAYLEQELRVDILECKPVTDNIWVLDENGDG